MSKMSIDEIKTQLKKVLTEERYNHTISTVYTAQCLAMRYSCNLEKAKRAALLHDCAKCLPREEMFDLAEKAGYRISDIHRKRPDMLHAKVGSYLARVVYGEDDEDVLNAIRYHTTGRPHMSLLEKIIYLADYIEPDRKYHEEIVSTRKLAFMDLDIALEKCLREILEYLRECNYVIDPATEETYQHFYNIIYQNMFD